jgi:hypothetical protein
MASTKAYANASVQPSDRHEKDMNRNSSKQNKASRKKRKIKKSCRIRKIQFETLLRPTDRAKHKAKPVR